MEKALTEILMSLPDAAIAASDSQGNLVVFSPGFADILGDVHPTSLTDLDHAVPLHTEDGERRLEHDERPLVRASRGEVVRDLIAKAQHTDGTWRYLRFNAAPIRSGNMVSGAITLVQDVTSAHVRHLQETQLHDQLITTINHHFRTPLSLVLGHTEILEDYREDLPPQAQKSVDALNRGAKQLLSLTRSVSELVELQAARHARMRTADLRPHLQRQLTAQQRSAALRDVTLRLNSPDPFMVSAHHALLSRATGALLNNAIRYAPPGTAVDLELGATEGTRWICVTDLGPGIPPGEADRLLQPFETGGSSTDTQAGRGLGLALAQTVAIAHGGFLQLSKNQPTGLRATITWPGVGSTSPLP